MNNNAKPVQPPAQHLRMRPKASKAIERVTFLTNLITTQHFPEDGENRLLKATKSSSFKIVNILYLYVLLILLSLKIFYF